jgi:dsRNA-specific ribonuclease
MVSLPNSVSSSVRQRSGLGWWRTERAARKDAAFQAYKSLYEAGLLNDNLLPLTKDVLISEDAEKRPSTINVPTQISPWIDLAELWSSTDGFEMVVTAKQVGSKDDGVTMPLILPSMILASLSFDLYWDSTTTFRIDLETAELASNLSTEFIQLARQATQLLLRSARTTREHSDPSDYLALFCPETDVKGLQAWLRVNQGSRSVTDELIANREPRSMGLVRCPQFHNVPQLFLQWHVTSLDEKDEGEEEIQVECITLAKKRNFLSGNVPKLVGQKIDKGGKFSRSQKWAAETCTFDCLPFELVQFGLFIRPILQHLEVFMIATRLCKEIIHPVVFKDIRHVETAICAPSAQWSTNYERYEFIGDSVLKFLVSCQLFVQHPNWYEGLLTKHRNSFVSNKRLANAALDAGLDAFILTESFAKRDWAAPTVRDLLGRSSSTRDLSSKTIADVVEALIGAAFVDSGFAGARACINVFLPDIGLDKATFKHIGSDKPDVNVAIVGSIPSLERLLGRTFHSKAWLAEAITHPSCEGDVLTESYQRLEFLGDAVLDMIIVSALYAFELKIPQGKMTKIKAALVNGHLLAFLCMELTIMEESVDIVETRDEWFMEQKNKSPLQLWRFMRYHGEDIKNARAACLERHQILRDDINLQLAEGQSYPWLPLIQLNAPKFFSDLVEGIIGAIFVDEEKGKLTECARFVERIGLLPYLRRIVQEDIHVAHPKTDLGEQAGSDTVRYHDYHEGNPSGKYACDLVINEVYILTVRDCQTKDEAIAKAAEAGVQELLKIKALERELESISI